MKSRNDPLKLAPQLTLLGLYPVRAKLAVGNTGQRSTLHIRHGDEMLIYSKAIPLNYWAPCTEYACERISWEEFLSHRGMLDAFQRVCHYELGVDFDL